MSNENIYRPALMTGELGSQCDLSQRNPVPCILPIGQIECMVPRTVECKVEYQWSR